jgi:hypothetical protein
MPRAMGIAAKLDWPMLPWPSDYITTGRPVTSDWNASLADKLMNIESAVHEWAGLAVYRLTGRLGDPADNRRDK